MPISTEIRIIGRPDLQKFISPIEKPRKRFLQAWETAENCIALARKMLPENSQGDYGQWNYNREAIRGVLYVPIKNNGLLTVSLSCGGDIGQDDINKAGFVDSYAYWQTEKFSYGLIVLPGGQWYENRNHPRETVLRKFFFYQQSLGGLLSLEEFGSLEFGWFDATNLRGTEKSSLEFENVVVPLVLDQAEFLENLRENQQQGKWESLRINLVAL